MSSSPAPGSSTAASGISSEDHLRWVVVVVTLGAVIPTLDGTIVNVAVRRLQESLETSLGMVQWVVSGYLLALAAAIPITGWLTRRYGAARVFVTAMALFTAASVLCGIAQDIGTLIAFRVIQGVAGGLILPVGQTILVQAAGPTRIARAMSAVGVPMFLAPVVGPSIGGALVDGPGWRWIFLINLPLGLVTVLLARRKLAGAPPARTAPPDLLGLVLAVLGTIGISIGLTLPGLGVDVRSPWPWSVLACGVALTAVFVLHCRRRPRPLLDLGLYRNPSFTAAAVTTFALGAALFGGSILLPLYLQEIRGQSALATGLLLAPFGAGAALAVWLSAPVTERLGGGRCALAGCVVALVTTVPFAFLTDRTSFVVVGVLLAGRGVGIGLAALPAMTAAYRALTAEQVPDASPQLNILQRLGGALGTALFTVVLQLTTVAGADPVVRASAYRDAFWWVTAATVCAAVATLVLARAERRTPNVTPV